MVRLVQHLVALRAERELEGDLGLACWDLSCLGHFNVVANQLDGLQLVEGRGPIIGKCCLLYKLHSHSILCPRTTETRFSIAVHVLYLDRVVEGLEDANTLGAQLQVHQALHAQEDAVMLQRVLRRQHNDACHCLLHTASLIMSETTDSTDKVYNNNIYFF